MFFNDRAKEIDKLPDIHDSSSSETEFFDTPSDNTGFELHGKSFLTTERDNQSVGSILNQSTQAVVKHNLQGYEQDGELTACNSDISSSTLSSNLTKLSSALSLLSFVHPNKITSSSNLESVKPKSEMTVATTPPPRGGKYNKKLAPLPPLPPQKRNESATGPIKATLVLQPGVVRSLSLESLNKEIFVNYSPKMRRRSRRRSPSSTRSSRSNDSASSQTTLSKMLRLPKKISQLNIPGKVKEKRNSWSDFFHTKKLPETKVQSKSVTSLTSIAENKDDNKQIIQRSGSQVSIRSLTDSPLAHRRLKIIRKFVDNDID